MSFKFIFTLHVIIIIEKKRKKSTVWFQYDEYIDHEWLINLPCKVFLWVCLLEKQHALHSLFFSIFFSTIFREYQGIRRKVYFTDHGKANTIPLFIAIKEKFSGLLFFSTHWNSPETS